VADQADAGATLSRYNVAVHGNPAGPPMLFAHGFGCDQNMWRHIWPAFAADYRIVLFDYIGMGESDRRAYDASRHASLDGYARDVLEICRALEITGAVFVGHSVSSMIGVLAAAAEPERFAHLVLVAPSPRFIDDADYRGGFTREDIVALLESMESNYLGWSSQIAPVIVAAENGSALAGELTESFCRADPDIARDFARVTFLSDNRADLDRVRTPALVLQVAEDALAPRAVGEFVHAHLRDSRLVVLDTTGHCPNLSAPDLVVEAMTGYLAA
jgi:sigma-B regulation protein RsbQ